MNSSLGPVLNCTPNQLYSQQWEDFASQSCFSSLGLAEKDLAALEVSLDALAGRWELIPRRWWYQVMDADIVLRKECPSPGGAQGQAQPEGALLFHSHGTRWNRVFLSSRERPCAQPTSLRLWQHVEKIQGDSVLEESHLTLAGSVECTPLSALADPILPNQGASYGGSRDLVPVTPWTKSQMGLYWPDSPGYLLLHPKTS